MSGEDRRPLSLRLATLLSGAVLLVLLVAGVAVNQVVSRSIVADLDTAHRGRVAVAAAALAESGGAGRANRLLHEIARVTGGRVELRDPNGGLLGAAGQVPGGPTERVQQAAGENKLVVETATATPPILRVFNLALVVAGAVSVLLIIVLALALSDRLTRPLRAVSAAARRLGSGDLAVRARGGPDRESAQLADAFNAMADRLQHSEALRRRAASDIAHDLATPATLLESQLQAMIDGVVPTDRDGLDRARSAATMLNGVIVQLGELIDAESASLARRPERVDLEELVDDLAAALGGVATERQVTLEVGVDGHPAAAADASHLRRALRNIVMNGIQHTPAGGRVSVRAAALDARRVELVVADTGSGISAEDLPHVFERFYRADRARSRGSDRSRSGSGIGLTIARDLLDANDGTIAIERTGADGTTFRIELPAG